MYWTERVAGWILFYSVLLVTLVAIKGGKVNIKGGYVAIGKRVNEEVIVISSTTGQCIGILCGVTHAE